MITTWILSEPCRGLQISAEDYGVYISGNNIDMNDYLRLKTLEPHNRLGRLLPSLIPQLVQLGIAQHKDNGILIKFDDFVDLEGSEIDAFDDLVSWSPFALEIEARGSLGSPEFHYVSRYYWGRQQINVDRLGCFVRQGGKFYQLEQQTFRLIEAIEKFNLTKPEERMGSEALIKFVEIKGIAQDVGAQIDRYMLKEKVVVPAKIGLDLIEEEDGRISFVPKIDSVPNEELFRVFMASDDPDDVYALSDGEGGRIRVLLDEPQREVLRRMRRVRHLGGVEKANVLRNPYEVFDGVASNVEIDLERFGPRVKGIGDFPFATMPFIKYEGTGIFGTDAPQDCGGAPSKFNAGIQCKYSDGTEEKVYFETRKELLDVCYQSKSAWESGKQVLNFKGRSIVVDKAFVDSISALERRVKRPSVETERVLSHQAYLLIYTNEEEIQYRENEDLNTVDDVMLSLPQSLVDESTLKPYQKEGIKWMQRNYRLFQKGGRKGWLLADEMGLGKTFQVLTFLAWLIEQGAICPSNSPNREIAPWNPILIVAPVILLENESWQKDMKKFFKYEGDVFRPLLILHGAEIRKRRRPGTKGRETELKEAVLNLNELRQYRVILTSYETVVNYQFSFACMKEAWTVIVTDEAQEYKTPNTKISHALKSLAPQIRVACTGTPVETKLMDVWNIFDFLQPGILGSASEFAKKYEQPIIEHPDRRDEVLAKLKRQLRFNERGSYLLRREKNSILDGLPAKHEHKEYCDMTVDQCTKHMDFISQVRKGAHPLAILPQLMKLYQHPDLLPTYKGVRENEVDELLEKSPKLRKIMAILKDIRVCREKALIFTRSLNMQQLLSVVISAKFGLYIDIINGAAPRSSGTKSGVKTRKDGIRRFCESEGFNVLVVSPDVAGVGLTIVEANHVIHYGRWWNPAKELQATDRVYRIGQQKDVHVYYPIACAPDGTFLSFDERLDNLLDRRKELARDFLSPAPEDKDNQYELFRDLVGEDHVMATEPLSRTDIETLSWDRFEALIALLEEKGGRKVILTPKSGDYGVDVLSLADRELFLIQCKHTIWGSSCDVDVIAEMINAFDNYRLRWLRGTRDKVLKPVLVTNGKLTKQALRMAKDQDILCTDYRSLMDLVGERPCSLAEIELMEGRRKACMKDVESDARMIFSADLGT
jgi:superfamily II DNA or RNA helicase